MYLYINKQKQNVMKKLIDFNTGDLGFTFEGTNDQILEWIKLNLSKFNLNESWSCSFILEGNEIEIRGDEDFKQIEIQEIETIKL